MSVLTIVIVAACYGAKKRTYEKLAVEGKMDS